jgi:adenosine kinase
MNVVIAGSIAFDYLMTFPGKFSDHLLPDQLDKISVSFLVDSMQRYRGGVAANIAYTNALLGGRPKIMAAVGRDFYEYGNWLESKNVDVSRVVIHEDLFCASFFVTTDEDQNQIAAFYTGAMARAAELTFAEFGTGADLAVISPNDPHAMVAYVSECKALNIPYIFDPSQQTIRLSAEDLIEGLTGCYLLAVNEYELSLIRDKTQLSDRDIIKRVGVLLITLGKRGSVIHVDDESYNIPAITPDEMVDPTGAGDAFRGGLIRGIQLGFSWPLAGRMGALASTFVLEKVGTQGHFYTCKDFVNRFRNHYDDENLLDQIL